MHLLEVFTSAIRSIPSLDPYNSSEMRLSLQQSGGTSFSCIRTKSPMVVIGRVGLPFTAVMQLSNVFALPSLPELQAYSLESLVALKIVWFAVFQIR